jgi:Family of unknown function (DUF5670)
VPHRPRAAGMPGRHRGSGMLPPMLLTIVGILVLLWLIGLVTNVVGGIIHAVLVIALIVLAVQFFQGKRRI